MSHAAALPRWQAVSVSYVDALREATLLAWVFSALLLLLAVISTLAARGTLRRNHGMGIRLPALFASDAAWQAGHAAAVTPAWVGFAFALASDLAGIIEPVARWATIAVFVATVIWALTAAIRAAHRA